MTNLNTVDRMNEKLEAVTGMLHSLKPSFATYAEAGEALIKDWTLIMGKEHEADLKLVTAVALEKIAPRKVIKLQGFGKDAPYVSINHPAARASLLKGNE